MPSRRWSTTTGSAALPEWMPDWSGETCIVVAGGPSAKDVPLAEAKGLARCIVINEGYRLAPWADALYAADSQWWQVKRGLPEFRGLKVSQSDQAAKYYGGIKLVTLKRVAELVLEPRGVIAAGSNKGGSGANSGFQALNLAAQFGATRILLVGYDMRLDRGVHWHGLHGAGLRNPTKGGLDRWRQALDLAAPSFAAAGIEVLNCSPVSALTAYPKVDFREALGAAQARAA